MENVVICRHNFYMGGGYDTPTPNCRYWSDHVRSKTQPQYINRHETCVYHRTLVDSVIETYLVVNTPVSWKVIKCQYEGARRKCQLILHIKIYSHLDEVIVFSSATTDEITTPCNRLRSLDQAKVRMQFVKFTVGPMI